MFHLIGILNSWLFDIILLCILFFVYNDYMKQLIHCILVIIVYVVICCCHYVCKGTQRYVSHHAETNYGVD